jgi:hypothetical protein
MSVLERLQKLSSSSAALRAAHLRKEAGFGSALAGAGKSIANKALTHAGKQIEKHGPIWGGLGLLGGATAAAAIPWAVSKTYKAYKSGFNPALQQSELGY